MVVGGTTGLCALVLWMQSISTAAQETSCSQESEPNSTWLLQVNQLNAHAGDALSEAEVSARVDPPSFFDEEAAFLNRTGGTESMIYRGCLQFVPFATGGKKFDLSRDLDSMVDQCKKGLFLPQQKQPIAHMVATCERAKIQINLQRKLLGDENLKTTERFCAAFTDVVMPLDDEPPCVRMTTNLVQEHLVQSSTKYMWPEIIETANFQAIFQKVCNEEEELQKIELQRSSLTDCDQKWSNLQGLIGKTWPRLAPFYQDICPILGMPVPDFAAQTHAIAIEESHEVRNGLARRARSNNADGRMKTSVMVEQTLSGKCKLSEYEKGCCSERARMDEIGTSISLIGAVSFADNGWGAGFNGWEGDTCVYREADFSSTCYGAGADVGVDVTVNKGWFYKFDYIPGDSIVGSGSICVAACAGFGTISDKNKKKIGGFYSWGTGVGIGVGTYYCTSTMTRDRTTKRFRNLKKNCCGGCFPAEASVETLSGLKSMKDLRVGDKVLTVDTAGQVRFDDIYFFGHADEAKKAVFVSLTVTNPASKQAKMLELSKKHFLPVCPVHGQNCTWSERVHVYAEKIHRGDYVWGVSRQSAELLQVSSVGLVEKFGVYNPYSLGGNIVVNGVLASAHSDWILDEYMSGYEKYLPSLYQALFLPGRWLYHLVGSEAADWLEVNNPQNQADVGGYGPQFLMVVIVGVALVISAMVWMLVASAK